MQTCCMTVSILLNNHLGTSSNNKMEYMYLLSEAHVMMSLESFVFGVSVSRYHWRQA